jgi:nucleotide-binding universal stress UspA family protein
MAVSPTRPAEDKARIARLTVRDQARRSGTFDRIVVPVGSDEPLSLRAVQAAARISSETATVLLVNVLEVPRELPLDALFPEEEAAARAMLRRAAAVIEAYGVHVVQRLERAYSAAPAILELADEHRAELIILGTPTRARRGRSAFGPTATSLLHRATCRVMLVTSRSGALGRRP